MADPRGLKPRTRFPSNIYDTADSSTLSLPAARHAISQADFEACTEFLCSFSGTFRTLVQNLIRMPQHSETHSRMLNGVCRDFHYGKALLESHDCRVISAISFEEQWAQHKVPLPRFPTHKGSKAQKGSLFSRPLTFCAESPFSVRLTEDPFRSPLLSYQLSRKDAHGRGAEPSLQGCRRAKISLTNIPSASRIVAFTGTLSLSQVRFGLSGGVAQ